MIETLNIDRKEGVVISKFFRLQTNPSSGKTYTHTMTRKGRDVGLMFTRMPNLSKWKDYEDSKDKFMDDLYLELREQQLKKKGKAQEKSQPSVKQLTSRELEVHTLYNVQGMTQEEIGRKLGISSPRVCIILKKCYEKEHYS